MRHLTAALGFTFLLVGAVACSSTTEDACSGYCRTDLECGHASWDDVDNCMSQCQGYVSERDSRCEVAFKQLAACYDDAATCAAPECSSSLEVFASNCEGITPNDVAAYEAMRESTIASVIIK
ncbi:hypothetical protein KAI87_13805 [Myxococcota bacterium]|nr:hypothetical protein [Myxococcota bacterium]